MNILHRLGLDSNEVYGGGLILIGVFFLVFAYVHWKKTKAWKKNKGEKTSFFEIWKPSTLIGSGMFILLGLAFWFGGNWLMEMREFYASADK